VLLGVMLASAVAGTAGAATLLSNSAVEISGTGSGKDRVCTIIVKASSRFGGDLAPQLLLTTIGRSVLSIAIDKSSNFSNVAMVQNNVRTPLTGEQKATGESFRSSLIGKALRSKRPFFLTGQRRDNDRYTSSRYEGIDFDSILGDVESNCPFDAESFMENISSREQAERSLSLSSTDLKSIRWALNMRYGGNSSEPSVSYSLSPPERNYLKSWAADNGYRVSQYLTGETARRLILEGQQIAREAKPPQPTPTPTPTPAYTPPPSASSSKTFQLKVCNKTSYKVSVALSGHRNPDSVTWRVEGWWTVNASDCQNITSNYLRGRIYLFAKTYGSDKTVWGGKDVRLCVEFPGPFDRANYEGYKCRSNEKLMSFVSFVAEKDTFTWTLTP
jgi:Protein of unknown function (DUF1036)